MTRLEITFGVPLLNPLNIFGPVLSNYQFYNKLFLPLSSILSSVCRLSVLRSLHNIWLSFTSLLITRGDLFCTILLNSRSLTLSKACFLLNLSASCIPLLAIINLLLKFVLTSFTKYLLLPSSFYDYLDVQLWLHKIYLRASLGARNYHDNQGVLILFLAQLM